MITTIHVPKFDIYLAIEKRHGGSIEIDYAADGYIADRNNPPVRTRSERLTSPTIHVLAVASTPHEAEIQAKLKLTRK